MKLLGPLFALALLAACRAPADPPTVKLCVALAANGSVDAAAARRTCRCADGIARRQLDPRAYRLLADLSAASLEDRAAGLGTPLAVGKFYRDAGPLDSAVAAADLSLVTVKAVTKCR